MEENSKDCSTECLTRDKLRRVGMSKLGDCDIMVSDESSQNAQEEKEDKPDNSDETRSDRGFTSDGIVNYDSEESSELDEEINDPAEEQRGRGRYNLRPDPGQARYEGYLAHYLTVF